MIVSPVQIDYCGHVSLLSIALDAPVFTPYFETAFLRLMQFRLLGVKVGVDQSRSLPIPDTNSRMVVC